MDIRDPEVLAVIERYARRREGDRYSLRRPGVIQMLEERRRAMVRLFADLEWNELAMRHALEVGCGSGGILLELIGMGFAPENLIGLELRPETLAHACRRLPARVQLMAGDASEANIEPLSQDVVLQFTVFSSLLDDCFQHRLAETMWGWVRLGGGVLWYDFTVNNPFNADVRGVPVGRIRSLFPTARITVRRITLAPPLARAVCRAHPMLYPLFNALPLLRTHVLAWIEKSN